MSEPTITDNPPARRSTTRRWLALGAVVLVPLAIAGLFVGALGGADQRLDTIPAAIVNEDSLVTQTAADGSTTQILAGRQIVTELTGPDSTGFDWQITNAQDAADKLASGQVYAVLTIPKDFSKSIVSLQSDDPVKASFSIQTDDAHGYVGAAVSGIVASSLETTLGSQITEQYIAGLFSGYSTLGSSLSKAADGATQIADGTATLSDGLGSLSDGATTAATGSKKYTAGVTQYTDGVGAISDGLAALSTGAGQLDGISTGVSQYTGTVSDLTSALKQINASVQAGKALDPGLAGIAPALQQVTDGYAALSSGGTTLATSTASGIDGVQSGIAQSAAGARRLDAGSSALVSGAKQLTSGFTSLADGAAQSQDGATKLASAGTSLADGLSTAAAQVPSSSDAQATEKAKVIASPVTHTATTDHEVTDISQILTGFLEPLGLWIGALAVFLVLPALSRRVLATSASGRRVVWATVARAGVASLGQAALLVVLLHTVAGVDPAKLPLTIAFSIVMALSFTAFHHFLSVAFGRAGLVASLVLLAVQLTATGGLYPIQLVAAPFQAISPFLPLTYGVSGMQAIITGGSLTPLAVASAVLVLFGVASYLLTRLVIRRRRRAIAAGLLPATA